MLQRSVRRLLSAGTLILALTLGQSQLAHATWSLVWYDEFNGTSLNTADWNIDIGDGCPNLCGWGNNELQYYRSENVEVTGGNLVLTAKAESFGGRSFTSGKITSDNKQSFLYGRIEARAKIPTGGGMWPAFWMMPEDDVYGGWAASGEIDIMESSNATTSIGGALHFGGQWPANTSTSSSHTLGGASFADDFHIYAIEWEPDEIRWYVDDVHYMTRTSADWYTNAAPGDPQAPFDQAFYIILNAAVGGWYTGCTNNGCITASLPQEFLIDYVRVYQDIVNAAPTVTVTSPGNGSQLPTGNITITATAGDTDGSVDRVEFWDGFNYLGEDDTAPYEYTWMGVTDGCYSIVARVIDNQGGVATDEVEVSVGLGCGQLPYLGSMHVFPTRIEAEDFDDGGEGIAYHDLDSGNAGGQYRPSEGVDIENCVDVGGGYNVGWVNPGEWTEYTVYVPAPGDYTLDMRVASLSGGGSFHLEFDGVDLSGNIVVPTTSGWQQWTTVSTTVTLAAGTQVMRFVPTGPGFNINSFEVVSIPTDVVPDGRAARTALQQAYPNPFNPSTTLRYSLEQRQTVHLSIHDVAGRHVRTLVDGEVRAGGHHEITWQGRDQQGNTVAAGVYYARLRAGDVIDTRRLVLVK